MDYRYLGYSGLRVSPLCLGTMMFGDRTDAAEAGRIVDSARQAGVNFIDTADVYSKGESERITGELIKPDRDRWVMATKEMECASKTSTSLAKSDSERVRRIHEAFAGADIQSVPVGDGRVPIWEKFVFLAALAGFTGYQQDPTGLDYARARYYNPSIGSFTSADTYATLNRYSYVNGKPNSHVDPDGHFGIVGESILQGMAIGAVSGLAGGAMFCPQDSHYVECIGKTTGKGIVAGAVGGLLLPEGTLAAAGFVPVIACGLGGLASVILGEVTNFTFDHQFSSLGSVGTDFATGCIFSLFGGGPTPGLRTAGAGA